MSQRTSENGETTIKTMNQIEQEFNSLNSLDKEGLLGKLSKPIIQDLVHRDPYTYHYIPVERDELKADPALLKLFVEFEIHESIGGTIEDYGDLYGALEALLEGDGGLLEYMPQFVKDSKRFVHAAIRNEGYNIKYASERLKEDYETVKIAVAQPSDSVNLFQASEKLHFDRELIRLTLEYNGEKLFDQMNGQIHLRDDDEMIRALISCSGGTYIQRASGRLQKDPDMLAYCLEHDHNQNTFKDFIRNLPEDVFFHPKVLMASFRYAMLSLGRLYGENSSKTMTTKIVSGLKQSFSSLSEEEVVSLIKAIPRKDLELMEGPPNYITFQMLSEVMDNVSPESWNTIREFFVSDMTGNEMELSNGMRWSQKMKDEAVHKRTILSIEQVTNTKVVKSKKPRKSLLNG